jgi:hypothetical protein
MNETSIDTSNSHEGGCLCGSVRYRVQGQPIRTLVCHCHFCQRVTGSTSYAESLFPVDAVSFSECQLKQYDHLSQGSGNIVHVLFCPKCGTTVGLTFDRWREFRAISRGTFDDPNWVSIGSHIWTESAQTGVVLPAHTDCFREARATLDGQPNSPERFHVPTPAREA